MKYIVRIISSLFTLILLVSCQRSLGDLWEENAPKGISIRKQIGDLCKNYSICDSTKNLKTDIVLYPFDEFSDNNEANFSGIMWNYIDNPDIMLDEYDSKDSSYIPDFFKGSVLSEFIKYTSPNSELKGMKTKSGKTYDYIFDSFVKIRYVLVAKIISYNRESGICEIDNLLCDLNSNQVLLVFRTNCYSNPQHGFINIPIDVDLTMKERKGFGRTAVTHEKTVHVNRTETIDAFVNALKEDYNYQKNNYLKRFLSYN